MWSTTKAEKNLLCRTILELERPRVLEIGAFKGETTRVLAEAASLRGGYVVVIDPMRWAAEVVANGIARHLPPTLSPLTTALDRLIGDASYEPAFWENVGHLRPHVYLHRDVSSSPQLIASRAAELQRFDVVFIDGDHSLEGARSDLWKWGTRTVVGGTILVHDAVPRFPGVRAALSEFAAAHGSEVRFPDPGSVELGSLASIPVAHALDAAREDRVVDEAVCAELSPMV